MPRINEADAIRSFLNDLWKQAQGMLGKGRRKTEEVARAARVKMDIYLLDVKRNDLYRKLGEYFYATSRRRKPSAKKQRVLLDIIREIRETDALEKSLRKSFSRRRKRGRPAKKPGRRGRTPGKTAARP